ncbi:MAG: DUF1501 domain-containing protein [Planctomycetaceae bacterium]
MLRILGSSNPFGPVCGRRDAMQVGALAGGALTLPELLRLESASAAEGSINRTFGRAKNILLLYLQGAASHFETWDPKPDAPEGIRGQWSAIPTAVPGTFICEMLPKLSGLTGKMALIRSMTHDHNNHSNLYTLSGFPAVDFSSETNPFDTRHRPFFGSVLDYLADRDGTGERPELPRNIGLPWQFSNFAPFSRRAGPYGSFLGHGYNPVWTEFDGKATRSVPRVSFFNQLRDVEVADPFLGITPESRLRISKDAQLRDGLTLDRLDRRRSLLHQLDDQRRHLSEQMAGRSLDRFAGMAYSLMTSSKLHDALDVGREPMSVREKYGMNLFGQSALTARRLLEAGCRLVSVFWDEYKVVNTAWDTHFNHFKRLGNELLPGFDAGVSSLLTDMDDRGMLDETLVLCLTEHGRTPKINNMDRGGGRDHWSKAYSVMLAGAGIRGGTVVGATDSIGSFVANRPVSPEDILATMYHLKGIAPETTIPDRGNRPTRLVDHGAVIEELLA